MAHGDYYCCVICDSKMYYGGGNAESKENICPDCIEKLVINNIKVFNTDQLLNWMKQEENHKVIKILDLIGFSVCYYENDIDSKYKELKDEVI